MKKMNSNMTLQWGVNIVMLYLFGMHLSRLEVSGIMTTSNNQSLQLIQMEKDNL